MQSFQAQISCLKKKKKKKKRTCYTAHLANKCLKLTLGLNNLQFIVKRSREKTEDEEMRKETKTVPTPKIVWHHELLILCGVTTRASRVFVHLFWSYAEDSFIRFLVHGHDNRLGHRAHPAVILHFGPLGLGLSWSSGCLIALATVGSVHYDRRWGGGLGRQDLKGIGERCKQSHKCVNGHIMALIKIAGKRQSLSMSKVFKVHGPQRSWVLK